MKFTIPQHHRRTIRLKGYDYTLPGAYFITILADHHKCTFGESLDGEIILSSLGRIIYDEWFRSMQLRHEILLYEDEFILMPNHLHGIVWLIDQHEKVSNRSTNKVLNGNNPHMVNNEVKLSAFQRIPHSLSTFISGFKSSVTSRAIHELNIVQVWHRNYYDHVIRSEVEFRKIWDYIDTNPQSWANDQLNPLK